MPGAVVNTARRQLESARYRRARHTETRCNGEVAWFLNGLDEAAVVDPWRALGGDPIRLAGLMLTVETSNRSCGMLWRAARRDSRAATLAHSWVRAIRSSSRAACWRDSCSTRSRRVPHPCPARGPRSAGACAGQRSRRDQARHHQEGSMSSRKPTPGRAHLCNRLGSRGSRAPDPSSRGRGPCPAPTIRWRATVLGRRRNGPPLALGVKSPGPPRAACSDQRDAGRPHYREIARQVLRKWWP